MARESESSRRELPVVSWATSIILAFCIIGQTGYANPKGGIRCENENYQPRVNCEDLLLQLEQAVKQVQQNPDSYLILIARLGDREYSSKLNRTRLKPFATYLNRFNGLNLVMAEGTKVKGNGRVELYVGGRLTKVWLVKTNSQFHCTP